MDKMREGWIPHPDGIEHVRVLGNARKLGWNARSREAVRVRADNGDEYNVLPGEIYSDSLLAALVSMQLEARMMD